MVHLLQLAPVCPYTTLFRSIAVPAELGEDEILVAVVPRPDSHITAQEIAAWCAARLVRIKVPRFVLFVDELPHTATLRVEKHKLKKVPAFLDRAIEPHVPGR